MHDFSKRVTQQIDKEKHKIQKQPFANVLENRCLQLSQESTCKAPVLESLSNKVAGLLIEERLLHRCFPGKFSKFLRTLFLIGHL